jgi:hypothetical protein
MPKRPPRRTAAERESRRFRIVASIQNGFGYDEIARAEAITHERVRQIVVESIRRNEEHSHDLRFVQAARLEPALKLTLQKIADGKLEAVDRLVKILDRLDKYLTGPKTPIDHAEIRERLIRRVEMAARYSESPENLPSADDHPPPPPLQPLENAQTSQEKSWTSETLPLFG